jgi:hypothetical protein
MNQMNEQQCEEYRRHREAYNNAFKKSDADEPSIFEHMEMKSVIKYLLWILVLVVGMELTGALAWVPMIVGCFVMCTVVLGTMAVMSLIPLIAFALMTVGESTLKMRFIGLTVLIVWAHILYWMIESGACAA